MDDASPHTLHDGAAAAAPVVIRPRPSRRSVAVAEKNSTLREERQRQQAARLEMQRAEFERKTEALNDVLGQLDAVIAGDPVTPARQKRILASLARTAAVQGDLTNVRAIVADLAKLATAEAAPSGTMREKIIAAMVKLGGDAIMEAAERFHAEQVAAAQPDDQLNPGLMLGNLPDSPNDHGAEPAPNSAASIHA